MRTIRIPALPRGLVSNLLGLAGLAAICVMIGCLTDWRWGGLAGGVAAVGVAALAAPREEQALAEPQPLLRPARKSAA
jgi:hypothetical protein